MRSGYLNQHWQRRLKLVSLRPDGHGALKTDMPAKPGTTLSHPKVPRTSPGRAAWLKAAKSALLRAGVRGVEVGKLARQLRATRGGFYRFLPAAGNCWISYWRIGKSTIRPFDG
jgi:hypothetical protein